MKVSPTKEVPRGKQDVLSGKPQRLWDYFKKLIRYLTESYEDLANAINYNERGIIVDSGSNSDGSYVRWADGTQVCYVHRLTLPYDLSTQCLATWVFPASFVSSTITCNSSIIGPSDSTAPNSAATNASPSTEQLSAVIQGNITSTSIDIAVQRLEGQTDFASGDEMYVTISAKGSWK